jgi:hypothetical protein
MVDAFEELGIGQDARTVEKGPPCMAMRPDGSFLTAKIPKWRRE